jgi:WD40 repeat protein
MRKAFTAVILSVFIASGAPALEISMHDNPPEPVRLIKKIPLSNIRSRLGHMAIDINQNRLFVTVPDSNSVEVINLNTGKSLNRMTLIDNPQSILYIAFYNWIVITSGRDGTCNFYDGNTYNRIRSANFSEAAECLYYEISTRYVYVGYGYGGMAVIDTQDFNIIEKIGRRECRKSLCERAQVPGDRNRRSYDGQASRYDKSYRFKR